MPPRHGRRRESACTGRAGRSRPCKGTSYPPRTTVEETVLDLAQAATSFDDVCGWVTRAIARELTDEARLQRGHDRAPEAALARGPARTHRRRRGRRPFGARVPLPPRRGASARPARTESAGAVRDAGRAARDAGTACTRNTAWWWSLTGGSRTRPRTSGRTRPGTTPRPRKESSRCGTAGRRSGGRPARPPRR